MTHPTPIKDLPAVFRSRTPAIVSRIRDNQVGFNAVMMRGRMDDIVRISIEKDGLTSHRTAPTNDDAKVIWRDLVREYLQKSLSIAVYPELQKIRAMMAGKTPGLPDVSISDGIVSRGGPPGSSGFGAALIVRGDGKISIFIVECRGVKVDLPHEETTEDVVKAAADWANIVKAYHAAWKR